MAVNIYTLTKPYFWVEAVTGGTLSPSTYYFIGWLAFCPDGVAGPYYGNVSGSASEEVSVTTDETNNRILMEIYYNGGSVTGFTDVGGGIVRVNTTDNNLTDNETIWIRGSVNYTGVYTITNVTINSFDITATWFGDDGTCKWFSEAGINAQNYPTNTKPSFYYKWDYYTMMRGDGSYVQWLNTNNPSMLNDEWRGDNVSVTYTYGHKRWSGSYFYYGMYENQFLINTDGSYYRYLDTVVITNGSVLHSTTNLYERETSGSVNGNVNQPELSLRKFYSLGNEEYNQTYYTIPDWMDISAPAVLIWFDPTDNNNTWSHLVNKLKDRDDILGKSIYYSNQGQTIYATQDIRINSDMVNQIVLRGAIIQDKEVGGSWSESNIPIIYDKQITIYQGNISSYGNNINNYLELNGCDIETFRIQNKYWINLNIKLTNTRWNSVSNSFVLQNVITKNFTNGPSYIPNSYVSVEGVNIIGSSASKVNLSNMPRYITTQYMKDVKFINITNTPTYTNIESEYPISWDMTNVEFSQVSNNDIVSASYYDGCNFDIMMESSYVSTFDIDFTTNCYHVTSKERPNGLVRVSFIYPVTRLLTTGSTVVFNFHEMFNITVLDEYGNPIENADVTIKNTNNPQNIYNLTTDVDGKINETNVFIYKIEYDLDNSDGYVWNGMSGFSKTTLTNDISIKVEKEDYITYNMIIPNVLDSQDMVINLVGNPNPIEYIINRNYDRKFTGGVDAHVVEEIQEGNIEIFNEYEGVLTDTTYARATYRPETNDILFEQNIDGIYEEAEIISSGSTLIRNSTSVIEQSNPLVISDIIITNPTKANNDGSIEIIATGGTTPYLYSIDGVNYVSGNTFNNLNEGEYTLYLKDAIEITFEISGILLVAPEIQAAIINQLNIINPSYNTTNGSIEIIASGDGSPYTYSINGIDYYTNNLFENLPEGNYSIYVKNTYDLVSELSGILLNAPDRISPTINGFETVDTTNPTINNGEIKIYASGGVLPYTYSINDGNFVDSNTFSGLGIGTYSISVKDSQGIVNTLSGIKIKPIKVIRGAGGRRFDSERYKAKVRVTNVKLNEIETNKVNVLVK